VYANDSFAATNNVLALMVTAKALAATTGYQIMPSFADLPRLVAKLAG